MAKVQAKCFAALLYGTAVQHCAWRQLSLFRGNREVFVLALFEQIHDANEDRKRALLI